MSSFDVGSLVGGEYKEVIHVDDEPSFNNHVSEEVIHEVLECGRGVIETEEHNGGFKQSFVGNEGCLPLVSILDVDIVVSLLNIKLGEVFHVFKFVNKVKDEGERIGISDGVLVQVAIVLAGAEFPVLLFDKEEGGGLGGVGGANLSQA